MKKIGKIILVLTLVLAMFGCGEKPLTLEQKIEGTWSFGAMTDYGWLTYTYDFEPEGKVEVEMELQGVTKTNKGTWKAEGGKIKCSVNGEHPTFNYVENEEDVKITYQGLQLTRE